MLWEVQRSTRNIQHWSWSQGADTVWYLYLHTGVTAHYAKRHESLHSTRQIEIAIHSATKCNTESAFDTK